MKDKKARKQIEAMWKLMDIDNYYDWDGWRLISEGQVFLEKLKREVSNLTSRVLENEKQIQNQNNAMYDWKVKMQQDLGLLMKHLNLQFEEGKRIVKKEVR